MFPGHVLISPVRYSDPGLDRFENLTADEVASLWQTAQHVGKMIEKEYNAESLSFIMQDGPAAGQTVKHCHIHIMPRRMDDKFNKHPSGADMIYPTTDKVAKQMSRSLALENPNVEVSVLQDEVNSLRRSLELIKVENSRQSGGCFGFLKSILYHTYQFTTMPLMMLMSLIC